MDLHKEASFDDAREVSLQLAKESAAHAETLAGLAGRACGALAQDGVGRLPAQRGLRVQRRVDRGISGWWRA